MWLEFFYDLFISRHVFELNKMLVKIWRTLVKFLALRISMFESLVFVFWSVSVPKQPPLKLKSACNEIAEDC